MTVDAATRALRGAGMRGDAAWLHALRAQCCGVLGVHGGEHGALVCAAAFVDHARGAPPTVPVAAEESPCVACDVGVPVRVVCFVHAATVATQGRPRLHPAVRAWLQRCTAPHVAERSVEAGVAPHRCAAVCVLHAGVAAAAPPEEGFATDHPAQDSAPRDAQSAYPPAGDDPACVLAAQGGSPLGRAVHADDCTLHGALPLEWSEEGAHLPVGYVVVEQPGAAPHGARAGASGRRGGAMNKD